MAYVKRALDTNPSGCSIIPVEDPEFLKKYPAIWEYLTMVEYEPGKSRVTATLLLFTEDGGWKSCVNDRDNERSGFCHGETFVALLKATEGRLASGTMDWRRWQVKKRKA